MQPDRPLGDNPSRSQADQLRPAHRICRQRVAAFLLLLCCAPSVLLVGGCTTDVTPGNCGDPDWSPPPSELTRVVPTPSVIHSTGTPGVSSTLYVLPFDRQGNLCSTETRSQIDQLLEAGGYTDIYLVCPGWNDNWYTSVHWMTNFASGYERSRTWAIADDRRSEAYKPLYIGLLWPGAVLNRAYPARSASGRAVDLRPDVDRTALLNVIGADPDEAVVARIHQALIDRGHQLRSKRLRQLLEQTEELTPPQQIELADALLPLFGPQAEPSTPGKRYALTAGREPVVRAAEPRKVGLVGIIPTPLPPISATELLDVWKESVRTASARIQRPADEPGDDLSLTRRRGLSVPELVRWALHATDLRVIKDRAYLVGRAGIADLLKDLQGVKANVHVVAHSFGAEAVLAALQAAKTEPASTSPATRPASGVVDNLMLLSPLVNAWALSAPPMVGRDVLPSLQAKATGGGYRSAVTEGVRRSAVVVYSTRDWFAGYYAPLALSRPPFEGMAPVDNWAGQASGFATMGGVGPQGVEPPAIQQDLIAPSAGSEGPLRYSFPPADGAATGPAVIAVDASKTITAHGDANDRTTWWLLANQVESTRSVE